MFRTGVTTLRRAVSSENQNPSGDLKILKEIIFFFRKIQS